MKLVKIVKNHFFIIIIILIGLSIRLIGIKDVGISHYDTAYYANIAKVPIFAIDWFFDKNIINKDLEGLGDYLKERGAGGKIIKPGHVFLIFLSFLIFGVKDYAIYMASTACSVGVIFMTYLIGKKMFNKYTGLIASALMATSGQNIIFSRTGYPQTDTMLLFCLAFFFLYYHLNSINREKNFWYFSVLSGLLVLFHLSVTIALGSLLFLTLINFLINSSKKFIDCIKDCIYCLIVMLIIFLTTKYMVDLINQLNPSGGQELSNRLFNATFVKAMGYFSISYEKLIFFQRMFWALEGPLVALLIPISISYLVWKSYLLKSINYIMILIVICLPLLFWIVNYATLKAIQVLLPFIAIAIGISIYDFFDKINSHKKNKPFSNVLINSFICLILFTGFLRSNSITSFRSGYNTAFHNLEKYLESHDVNFEANQNNLWPISYFYAGNIINSNPDKFSGKITYSNRKNHSDIKIIDWRQFIPGKTNINDLNKITENYEPIFQLHHSEKAYPIWHFQRWYDYERIPKLFEKYPEARFISIYDLRDHKIIYE